MISRAKYLNAAWLAAVIVFIGAESWFHFDKDLIEKKKRAYSAQKDWSLFFGQSHVYMNGGFRHDEEFRELTVLLEPNTALITDLATSYYIAANLPVYVKNVYRHHGRQKSQKWEKLISQKIVCYLDLPDYLSQFENVVRYDNRRAKRKAVPPVRYVAVNLTQYNENFTRGCMSQRRKELLSVIDQMATPVYEGNTIAVFKLSAATSNSD